MKHTIQIHLDNDQIYFAFLRKKSEYSARTWSEMVYKICNMPVLSQQSEDDKAKCQMLYEVLGKTKSKELKKKCLHRIGEITQPQLRKRTQAVPATSPRQKALDELVIKRGELMELVDDPDLDEAHHKQCVDMLVLMDKVIKDYGT